MVQAETMAVTTLQQKFSASYYSQRAVLEAMHEVSSQFPCTAELVGHEHVVSIEGVAEPAQQEAVKLWLVQLVNDAELRERIEVSLGRVRDVVVAAAFSKILETSEDEGAFPG